MTKKEQTTTVNPPQSSSNCAENIPGVPTEAEIEIDARALPYLTLVQNEADKRQGQKPDTDKLSADTELEFHNQSLEPSRIQYGKCSLNMLS